MPSKRVRRLPEKIMAIETKDSKEDVKKTDQQVESETTSSDNKTK